MRKNHLTPRIERLEQQILTESAHDRITTALTVLHDVLSRTPGLDGEPCKWSPPAFTPEETEFIDRLSPSEIGYIGQLMREGMANLPDEIAG